MLVIHVVASAIDRCGKIACCASTSMKRHTCRVGDSVAGLCSVVMTVVAAGYDFAVGVDTGRTFLCMHTGNDVAIDEIGAAARSPHALQPPLKVLFTLIRPREIQRVARLEPLAQCQLR